MALNYVCDIECNDCQRRCSHETWKDASSKGCLHCGSDDIGYIKTYGHCKLRTNCQVCNKIYEGAIWDELPKECCDMHTLPLGEMPPEHLKWWYKEESTQSWIQWLVAEFMRGYGDGKRIL